MEAPVFTVLWWAMGVPVKRFYVPGSAYVLLQQKLGYEIKAGFTIVEAVDKFGGPVDGKPVERRVYRDQVVGRTSLQEIPDGVDVYLVPVSLLEVPDAKDKMFHGQRPQIVVKRFVEGQRIPVFSVQVLFEGIHLYGMRTYLVCVHHNKVFVVTVRLAYCVQQRVACVGYAIRPGRPLSQWGGIVYHNHVGML